MRIKDLTLSRDDNRFGYPFMNYCGRDNRTARRTCRRARVSVYAWGGRM